MKRRLRCYIPDRILGYVRADGRFSSEDWVAQDLEKQHLRLHAVPIADRLQEVIAWSAVLLADELARSDGRLPNDAPDPVGLGTRRP